jgi:hypothetical protein
MYKSILQITIVIVLCGVTLGVDSEVSWIPGDKQLDFSRTPADPTTSDIISFVIPTDVFDNQQQAEHFLGGTPTLDIDTVQKRIDLVFALPAPNEPIPTTYDPVSGLKGSFGPLEEGSWILYAQFQGVIYIDPFDVSSSGTTPPPQQESFVEYFMSNEDPFDLMNKSVLFSPSSDGTSYTAQIRQISQLPTNPSGGVNLALGDDSYSFVKLSSPETVSIYGDSFTGFYVGSNGYITFTEGDQTYSESLVNQFDTLRVSGLFDDLSPNVGGQVSWNQLSDRAAVTWQDVPEYGTNNSNTFQIELFYNGNIQISWTTVDAVQAIVGLSNGLGVPPDFQETDFSELSGSTPPPPALAFPVEQFTSEADAFDLQFMSVTFEPVGDGTSYTAQVQQITQLPTDPSGGTDLGLGDDSFAFVKLASPAIVSIYGSTFTGIYVGSNGYITFTEGDQTYSESLANQFDTLRVSGLFDDLSPNAGGQVSWKQLSNRVVVTWENVPEYGTNNSNTFQIALFYDGSIQISWTSVDAILGIVGLSDGLGVPPDFQETDFSELSTTPPPPVSGFPVEQFTTGADAFDLSFMSVTFDPTADETAYDLSLQQITKLPTEPSGGTNLALGDDASAFVKLASPAMVSIYGNSFSGFYVGSNGYITFTGGDTEYSDTLENQFNTLRVSGFFHDLNPSAGGKVSWKQLDDRAAVTWQNVPEYGQTSSNTFQIELFFDGRIRLSWLEMAAESGIVGLSNGEGVPPDFVETDFSELSTTPPPPPPVSGDYLTEQFSIDVNPFDLQYTSVTFTPTANGASYSGSLQNITELPTDPFGGTKLPLGDDNFVLVSLSGQERVRIFNQSFSAFFVGTNGYITFTRGDTNFSPTLTNHFDTLRISGLFCDLTAVNNGTISSRKLVNRVAVTWLNVPEFSNTAPNTFQIEMFYDGRIRLSWLEIGSQNNIVGLSNGQGLPPDFEETDFSVQYAQP